MPLPADFGFSGHSGKSLRIACLRNQDCAADLTPSVEDLRNRRRSATRVDPGRAVSTAEPCAAPLSVDHSAPFPIRAADPLFLSVKAGMTVIVRHLPPIGVDTEEDRWWMADVIHVDGGARNPKVPKLFQVADVDTGTVQWINADLVKRIVPRV